MRVLIVDDLPEMRLMVRIFLREVAAGATVVGEAASRVEAVRLWKESRPDVTLMDNRMPDGSGMDASREILAIDAGAKILLFSAYINDDVERSSHEIGITRCIPKGDLGMLGDALKALT